MVSQRARHALVTLIAGVWLIQFIAKLGFGFEPDSTVNTAFLIVTGSVFSVEAFRRYRDGGGEQ